MWGFRSPSLCSPICSLNKSDFRGGGSSAGDTGNSGQHRVNLETSIRTSQNLYGERPLTKHLQICIETALQATVLDDMTSCCDSKRALFISDMVHIHESLDITCFVCRSPACDPSAGPASQLRPRGKHRTEQGQHPPAWFTFPRGRTSPVSQKNLLPPRAESTPCS